jgi:hypothetical protein
VKLFFISLFWPLGINLLYVFIKQGKFYPFLWIGLVCLLCAFLLRRKRRGYYTPARNSRAINSGDHLEIIYRDITGREEIYRTAALPIDCDNMKYDSIVKLKQLTEAAGGFLIDPELDSHIVYLPVSKIKNLIYNSENGNLKIKPEIYFWSCVPQKEIYYKKIRRVSRLPHKIKFNVFYEAQNG